MSISFCKLNFQLKFTTDAKQIVVIIGNIPDLGMWDPNKGLKLIQNEEERDVWTSLDPLELKKGTQNKTKQKTKKCTYFIINKKNIKDLKI